VVATISSIAEAIGKMSGLLTFDEWFVGLDIEDENAPAE
jgi:hypothetical protein